MTTGPGPAQGGRWRHRVGALLARALPASAPLALALLAAALFAGLLGACGSGAPRATWVRATQGRASATEGAATDRAAADGAQAATRPIETDPSAFARYVLKPKRGAVQGSVEGLLSKGQRVALVAGKFVAAKDVAPLPLRWALKLPASHGSGFLFTSDAEVYRATDYLAPLVPFARLEHPPLAVSLGPGFFLFRTAAGQIALEQASGHSLALPVPGLIQVGVTRGGQALGLSNAAESYVYHAGRWRDVSRRLPRAPVSILEAEGSAAFDLDTSHVRVDGAGELFSVAPLTHAGQPRLKDWQHPEAPLTCAVASGVPLGAGRAACVPEDRIAVVNLKSGELERLGEPLLAKARSCSLLEQRGEPLALCRGETFSVIANPLSDPRPERSFDKRARASYAAGTLVVNTACDGTAQFGRACIRTALGQYQDVDLTAAFAALYAAHEPKQEPEHNSVEWFAAAGGAVAWLRPLATFVDVRSGQRVTIAEQARAKLDFVLRNRAESRELADAHLIALGAPEELLAGYFRDGSFRILRSGQIEIRRGDLKQLRNKGAAALGVHADGRVFESLDYGTQWRSVEAGPVNPAAAACSALGCVGTDWLRLGWGGAAPSTEPVQERVAELPRQTLRTNRLPQLVCEPTGAATQKTLAESDDHELGLGARKDPSSRHDFSLLASWPEDSNEGALLALIRGLDPQFPSSYREGEAEVRRKLLRPKTFHFSTAFDPSARVTSQLSNWRAEVLALLRYQDDLYPLPRSNESGTLVPVLAPQQADFGIALQFGVSLYWLQPGRAVRGYSVGDLSPTLRAAASSDGTVLSVLLGDDTESRVVELGRPHFDSSYAVAGQPQSLAFDAAGRLLPVYDPAGTEPASADDPLRVKSEGDLRALAPWANLHSAEHALCQPATDDVRLVVSQNNGWLDLQLNQPHFQHQHARPPMRLQLRGNAERLCLEAVELAVPSPDVWEYGSTFRVVARFGPSSAGLVALTWGSEYRQALRCTLRERSPEP